MRVDWDLSELRTLQSDMNGWLKKATRVSDMQTRFLAQEIIKNARKAMSSYSPQLAASTGGVNLVKDGKSWKVSIGGDSIATSSGASVGDIIFGAEFGSGRFPQFPDYRVEGRAIWPAYQNAIEKAPEIFAESILTAIVKGLKRG